MRVAVLHNLRRGGAARRLHGTVTALAARGDVELREFALSGGVRILADERSVRIERRELAPALPRLIRPPLRYVDIARLHRAWELLADTINEWGPDVVFANPCGVLLAAPPALPTLRAPSVYYCDEPRRADYEPRVAQSLNPQTRLLYRGLRLAQRRSDRRAIAAADELVTNSQFTAAAIQAAYGRAATVVTPGVAPAFQAGPLAPAASGYVLSVGSLIRSKGHDLAIAAAAECGLAIAIVVVAPIDNPGERARLQLLADEQGIELRVCVGITDEELAELYRQAFATLYLACDEPLGLASLESQACGTPVIVADEGGLPETIEPDRTGFAVRRNPAAAAAALRLLAEPAIRPAMSSAAARRPAPRDDIAAARLYQMFDQLGSRARADRSFA